MVNSKNKFQRSTDKFVITARELSSRGMSFMIVMLGVLLQASHTTLLMYDIAAFRQDWLKFVVALGIGLFVSSALALFTIKYDGKDKNIYHIINVFFYFEVFTNIFYYFNSLIFSSGIYEATMQQWLYLIIAMPFSYVMPFAIKQFAGVISADERIAMGSIDDEHEILLPEDLKTELIYTITELIDHKLKAYAEENHENLQKLENFNPDDYLKYGLGVKLQVGDKASIVTLTEPQIQQHKEIQEAAHSEYDEHHVLDEKS